MRAKGPRRRGAAAGFEARLAWPPRRPGRGRRLARRAGGFVAGLLALGLAGGGALWLRLSEGPIPLDGLAARIEAAAAAGLPGARLEIGRVVIGRGDAVAPRPGLRFEDVRLLGPEGGRIVAFPEARVDLRPLDLLLGRIRPSRIVVRGAAATLVREADGGFRLAGLGAAAGDAGEAVDAAAGADPAAVLDAVAAAPLLSGLVEARFDDAGLLYLDRAAGRRWRAERADAALRRREDGALEAVVSALSPDGALGPSFARVQASREADGVLRARMSFSGLAPADLAALSPDLAPLAALSAPVQGRAEGRLDAAGGLSALSLDLRAGAGTLAVDDLRLPIDAARIAGAVEDGGARIRLDDVALSGPSGRIALSGAVTAERGADGAPVGAVAQLDVAALEIADPALYDAPARFDGGAATLRVAVDPLSVDVASLHLARDGFSLDAKGAASLGDAGWEARATGSVRSLRTDTLLALWPKPVAPGAFRWGDENLEAGLVERLDFGARFGPDGAAGRASFAFRDVRAAYLPPMPPVENARGWAEIDAERFQLTLAEGHVEGPDGGRIDLAGSALRVLLDRDLEVAEVALSGRGPLTAVMALLDTEPLALISDFGLDPAAVGGSADAQAALTFPLLRDLPKEEVGLSVVATLTDPRITPPGLDLPVAAEALRLEADADRLRLSGDARIDGVPARIDWAETFSPEPGAPRTRVSLSTEATPERLAALGVEAGDVFAGRAPISATVMLGDEGAAFEAEADLGPARLAVSRIGWRKPEGTAATATAAGRIAAGGGVTLDGIGLDAPGLAASGSAGFGADGGLRRLSLDTLRLGETTDITLSVDREGNGFAARIGGARLDLAALAEGAAEAFADDDAETAETPPPFRADIAVDRLDLGPAGVLETAVGSYRRGADGALEIRLEGAVGGGAPARLALDGTLEGGGRLTLEAGDAGALLRTAGVFEDGVGGRLTAEADVRTAGGLALEGTLSIADFSVADDAGLRRLLATADLPEAEARIREEGLTFDTVSAAFSLADDVLSVRDAAAVGNAIGLTVRGDYDLAADRLDLRGVFTPLYAVNSALGGIPVLGTLLTGGEGQGVFAVNFRVTGPAENPDFDVDPFSGLLPGALRRLLEAPTAEDLEEGRRNVEALERLRELQD